MPFCKVVEEGSLDLLVINLYSGRNLRLTRNEDGGEHYIGWKGQSVKESNGEKETRNYLVESGWCKWGFWAITFTKSNLFISLCSEDATADIEEIWSCQAWVCEILCWNETGRLEWENLRNLFVRWRRILEMLVVKEFRQERNYRVS